MVAVYLVVVQLMMSNLVAYQLAIDDDFDDANDDDDDDSFADFAAVVVALETSDDDDADQMCEGIVAIQHHPADNVECY